MTDSQLTNLTFYRYLTFNTDNWNYNIDKIFFLVLVGMLYVTTELMQNNFEGSLIEILARTLSAPFVVVLVLILFEATLAILVKIALEPGLIIESKFKIIPKIFYKSIVKSYSTIMSFKPINNVKITPDKPITLMGYGITESNFKGEITITGYMKIPDHFK